MRLAPRPSRRRQRASAPLRRALRQAAGWRDERPCPAASDDGARAYGSTLPIPAPALKLAAGYAVAEGSGAAETRHRPRHRSRPQPRLSPLSSRPPSKPAPASLQSRPSTAHLFPLHTLTANAPSCPVDCSIAPGLSLSPPAPSTPSSSQAPSTSSATPPAQRSPPASTSFSPTAAPST